MMLDKNCYKKYKKDGYFVYKNLISSKNCDILNKKVLNYQKKSDGFELDKNYPFSLINNKTKVVVSKYLKNQKYINKLINAEKILKIAELLTKKKLRFWYKKIYPKNAFDGQNELYHQDYFYHIGKGPKNESYIQCFIALDSHNIDGGCLKIFKGSHKKGVVKHHLVMTSNGISKYTISADDLLKISKRYKLLNLELKKGSCVFFNYNTIHGSSSNATSKNQMRMVCQMLEKNIYQQDGSRAFVNSRRTNKEINILKKMINTLKKNKYKPTNFEKGK